MHVLRSSVFVLVLLCCMAISAHAAVAEQRIQDLRGGTVLIHVTGQGAVLRTELSPTYGWDEDIVLHGPDGRIFATQPKTSRTASISSHIALEESGLYVLRLKRSYDAKISCEGPAVLAIKPLRYQTYFRKNTRRKIYFTVPEGTRQFSLSCTNRIGLRGENASLTITSPGGEQTRVRHSSFSPGFLRRKLNISGSNKNQELSSFSPSQLPAELLPIVKHYSHPTAGLWELTLEGGELGIWLDGVPDIFFEKVANIDSMLAEFFSAPPVSAKILLEPNASKRVPVLGAVGHIDPVRYHSERVAFGLQADQIFLWPPENSDGEALRVPVDWIKADEPQMHTLLILRGRANWMRKKTGGEAAGFAEWSANAVKSFIDQSKREKSSFTVQVLSEPNLEMTVDEYCSLFAAVVQRFEQDPMLSDIRLAGPGIGSGDESGFIDWEWMDAFLKSQGTKIAAVSWNSYKVYMPEDSYQLAETVHTLKKHTQALGIAPDVLIGGINRMGGLAPIELFTGDDAGIWWASALASLLNTGEMTGIWYFNLADSGMRKKGLIVHDDRGITIKPQGYAHRLFVKTLGKGSLLRLVSDHDLIDGVAVEDNTGQRHVILINKGWLPVEVDMAAVGKKVEQVTVVVPQRGSVKQLGNNTIMLPPLTLISTQITP